METGLEKMRNKITNNPKWTNLHRVEDQWGDCIDVWYNETIDVKCYMHYEKDMDQEYYLIKIVFTDGSDGEELEVE